MIGQAVDLIFQILAWIAGIWLVWWVIAKLTSTNQMIEDAKNLPGGANYQDPDELDKEDEEPGACLTSR